MNNEAARLARDAERDALAADPRLLTGEAILHAPTAVPAIWGAGSGVAWPEGEALFVTGPPGVAKSTLMQRLALARAGIGTGRVLDLPVRPDAERIVLYLACDRPPQVLRSWRRMVGPGDEHALRERVLIWRGPMD